MDKSVESSSDSDSNSSTSWVFVSDATASVENNTNTFHLDCSREPIQELTEQDLLSASSDIESDTDGISVISESEVPAEEPLITASQSSNSDEIEDLHEEEEDITLANTSDSISSKDLVPEVNDKSLRWLFKINNCVGVGLILTAIFLASYLSTRTNDELQDKNGPTAVQDKTSTLKQYKNQVYETVNDLSSDIGQIVDITLSCTYGQKTPNHVKDQEIKKCVHNEYKTKTYSKTNEQNKDDKNVILKRKEKYENIKHKYKQNVIKQEINRKFVVTGQVNGVTNREFMKKNKHTDQYRKNKGKYECDKLKSKKVPVSNKPLRDHNKKKNYKNKDDKEKYPHFHKTNLNGHEGNYNDNSRYKSSKSTGKNRTTKYKINHFKDRLYVLEDNNNTTTGEWYTNLYKARNQLRKEEHASDWMFERAYIRNKKRNKAQWYFKWMDVRAQLRHKQNYRPYSS